MKINQLFVEMVDEPTVEALLQCFGLHSLQDAHFFSRKELALLGTVERLQLLKPQLQRFYLRCKANVYLENLTLKKCITVLKQVIRLYGYCMVSHEKNVNNRKTIYYQVLSEAARRPPPGMRLHSRAEGDEYVLDFD